MWTEIDILTGNMNRIEKDTRNEPITKTGTQIHTETDTKTRIGTRIMIEKYGVKGPIYQNQD